MPTFPDEFLPTTPYWRGLKAMVDDGVSPDLLADAMTHGLPYQREISPGRFVGVEAMTFGKGRLWVGDGWFYDRAY